MHVLLGSSGPSKLGVGRRPWESAGFREPILADFGKHPTSRTRGQTRHYEVHMCTSCRNKHKESMGGLSCASGRGHVGTCSPNTTHAH